MANSLGNLSASALFSAAGQTVLITEGCSRTGIIAATTLVENGAKVYIASKDEIRLQEIQEELSRRGPGSCDYIVANLESKQGCVAFCASFKEREPYLHVLINNSGATWGGFWDDFPDSSWDLELASYVKSLLYVTGGLTELLAKAATSSIPGRIINIPIQVLRDCREGQAEAEQVLSYDTHKSAVSHLTTVKFKRVSLLTPFAHSVNAILPDVGLTNTMHINRDIISPVDCLRVMTKAFGTSTLFKTLPASYCFLLLEWGHVSQEQGSRVKRSKRITLPGGGAKGPVPVLSKREE
ncbi:Rhamnolipids biosynthesis 3-oxoacyl-reductase, partial [Rhizoctonia solani]